MKSKIKYVLRFGNKRNAAESTTKNYEVTLIFSTYKKKKVA